MLYDSIYIKWNHKIGKFIKTESRMGVTKKIENTEKQNKTKNQKVEQTVGRGTGKLFTR